MVPSSPASSHEAPNRVSEQQERPQFHTLDDTYEDACDFGKFALNPCGYLVDVIARCAPKFAKYLHNHLAQIVYKLVVFGSWTVVFLRVYPLLTPTGLSFHKNVGRVVFLSCVASWYFVSNTCPGNITSSSISRFDNYAYDGWLYKNNNICPTLHIRKLARSKYDRYTSRHIPRFDHYCIWIGQPIGEENYRLFLLFLTIHLLMCAYGSIILYKVFCFLTLQESFLNVIHHHLAILITLAIMICMTGLLAGFLSFHLFLISKNTTANEYQKWKDIKSWHEEATCQYQSSLARRTNAANIAKQDEEYATVTSNMVDPGLMPTNAYDMGHLANIHEVMFPRSMRQGHQHEE
jgi:palmitoyltransferase